MWSCLFFDHHLINQSIAVHFESALSYLDELRQRGERVLCHCVIGKSRSASVVLVIIRTEKLVGFVFMLSVAGIFDDERGVESQEQLVCGVEKPAHGPTERHVFSRAAGSGREAVWLPLH